MAGYKLLQGDDLSKFTATIIEKVIVQSANAGRIYMCELDGNRFLTKIIFYRKPNVSCDDKLNYIPQPDMEVMMLNLLRDNFIYKNITPYIVEMHYHKTFDNAAKNAKGICKTLEGLDVGTKNASQDLHNEICNYKVLVEKGLAVDKLMMIILEVCDVLFSDYLSAMIDDALGEAVFKSLLFGIIYTFDKMQKKYPGIKHGDLHTSNLMIKYDRDYHMESQKYLVFEEDGYAVPFYGMYIKIIDFGYGRLPTAGVASNINCDPYYAIWKDDSDLLLVFRWIFYACHQYGLSRAEIILSKLDPARTFAKNVHKPGATFPTPHEMLKNPIFNEYRKRVSQEDAYKIYQ